MYQIKVDSEKNRFYATLGVMGTGDGEKVYLSVIKAIKKLKPGFTAVSDISGFSVTDPKEAVWVEKIIKHLADAGMAKVARVTGSKSDLKEKVEKHGYKVVSVTNIEEADQILDQA